MPIPGTTKPARLVENCTATEVTLAPNDIKQLQEALDGIELQGERYPADFAQQVGK